MQYHEIKVLPLLLKMLRFFYGKKLSLSFYIYIYIYICDSNPIPHFPIMSFFYR